ncbi:MAG: PspC domain-containing protein [Pedobacter sp.]|nr:MAG: PspC domain-containing protein [Pedobacter sp.]
MKKTIIINIGNSIVHIEEDAYEILTVYLNEIKQHFAGNADDFEIVTDIENRIAEMFSEILQANQLQVITEADVAHVIAQMGRVQDFQTDEDESYTQEEAPVIGVKKLYRDTEYAAIAGVCAGLSHYLNIDRRWIRILAFSSVFLGGAGILAYVILWIAIPRAITRSEKMEMKGETTNLYGYKRSFEEELAAFKADEGAFQMRGRRQNNFVQETVGATGRMFNSIGRGLSKTLAAFIVVFGFACLIGLVVCLAAFLGFVDGAAYQYFPFSIINDDYRTTLAIAVFVSLFIPILALVLFSIRVAFNKKAINKSLSFGLLIIWLVGFSMGVYYGAKISSEFKEHAEMVRTTPLLPFKTYVIDADQKMVLSREDSINYNLNQAGFQDRVIVDDSDDNPFRVPRNVHIDIEKSETGKTMLVQNFEAQGTNFHSALQNVKNIDYKFTQRQNVLTFAPRISLKESAAWRNQEVRLTLKVPVGTVLMLNDNIYRYLYFYHYNCNIDENQTSVYKEWVMTEEGLKCKAELDSPSADR